MNFFLHHFTVAIDQIPRHNDVVLDISIRNCNDHHALRCLMMTSCFSNRMMQNHASLPSICTKQSQLDM